jgi:predicted outer membrane repeat protein
VANVLVPDLAAYGMATHLAVTFQPTHVRPGAPFKIVVKAEDVFGGVDSSFNGFVTIKLLSNPGSSTLGGTLTLFVHTGVAVFDDLILNNVGAGYQLVATADGLGPVISGPIEVTTTSTIGIQVTTASDLAGHAGVSLRDAVSEALADASASPTANLSEAISFAAGLSGKTITLSQGPLNIPGTPGAGTITVDGGGQITLTTTKEHAFFLYSGANVVLSGLTIENTNNTQADGAILVGVGCTLAVSNCTFAGNVTVGQGGAIHNDGTLTVSNCTFSDNVAADHGGAIDNQGTAAVSNSTFFGDFTTAPKQGKGGAISNEGSLTVSNSTFASNLAYFGGAIYNDNNYPRATLLMINCTVSSNSATKQGGGIFSTAGGLTFTLQNSIVAGNFGGDISGGFSDRGNNVLGTGNKYPGAWNTDKFTDTPGLLQLDDYGGPTQTMALSPDSPAYGAGGVSLAVDAQGKPLLTDQRGQPRQVGGAVDIGAFQSQPILVTSSADTLSQEGMTLRDAVNLAEGLVHAAPGTVQTITIAGNISAITLLKPIEVREGTIQIDSQGTFVISGNNVSKLFQIDAGASLFLGQGATGDPRITFESGDPVFGAVANAGTLTVTNCNFIDNRATQFGGAIYNTGRLTVTDCTFVGNSSGVEGGAIDNRGTATVTDSALFGNSAGVNGGAIGNHFGATLTVANSTVIENTAPGGSGIWNEGTLTLSGGTVSGYAAPAHAGGTLVIDDTGDAGNATYTITATTVQINNAAPITYAGARGLILKGGSGTDLFNVEGTAAGSPVTIQTGAGTNTVNLTPTSRNLKSLGGALTVQGAGGGRVTALGVYDQANPLGDSYTITASTVQSTHSALITYANVTSLGVRGGGGKNTFVVGDFTHNLDNLTAHLSIQGNGPGDALIVDNRGPASATVVQVAPTFTITGHSVTRANQAVINLGIVPPFPHTFTASFDYSGIGDLTVRGGRGKNTYVIGDGSHNLDDLPARLNIQGGGPSDALIVDDRGPADAGLGGSAPTFTITGFQVTRTNHEVGQTANGQALPVNFTTAISYSGLVDLTVQGGNVKTSSVVGDASRNLDPLPPHLHVLGGGAGSSLTVDDRGPASPTVVQAAPTFIITQSNITRTNQEVVQSTAFGNRFSHTAMASIDYRGIDRLEVDGGSAPNVFKVESTAAATPVTLTGGSGSNSFSITQQAGNLDALKGSLTIDGNAAATGPAPQLYVYDQNNPRSEMWTWNGNTLTRQHQDAAGPVNTVITLAHLGWARVSLGKGDNSFAVQAVSPETIVDVVGGAGSNTLVGPDTANTWVLTGTGAGWLDNSVMFGSFRNLQGGAGDDVFAFHHNRPSSLDLAPLSGALTGNLDGGGGVNTLDYSGFFGDVTVNLPLGTATQVGGKVSHIQNVIGGQGNSLLVGAAGTHSLTGGAGRNFLIAGPTAATLTGGPGEDVLVGGTTAYDSNAAALSALFTEWTRTDVAYAGRVQHVLSGGGQNGSIVLDAAHFTSNGGGNTLTGDAGLDLFYGFPTRDTTDWNKNPTQGETFINDQTFGHTRLDLSSLSLSRLFLDGNQSLTNGLSPWLTLTPGTHYLSDGIASVAFTVAADGTVDYDASLNPVLSGRGTTTLTVHGVSLTIDASALGTLQNPTPLYLDGVLQAATAVRVTLLPGVHYFASYGGAGQSFTVADDGALSLTNALNGSVSGNTLTITGRAVKIDASALGTAQNPTPLFLDGILQAATVVTANLLPGRHAFASYGGAGQFFTIADDSTLSLTNPLNGSVSGSTLTVTGRAVRIDASALGTARNPTPLYLDGILQAAMVVTVNLLPGVHFFGSYGGSSQYFTVDDDGTLSLKNALNGSVSGNTLTVTGRAVKIDAGALGTAQNPTPLYLDGILQAATLITVNLLPGRHSFASYGGAAQYFTIADDGTLSLENALNGSVNGSTLTLTGRAVKIDASALGGTLYLDGIAQGALVITPRLLPGPHSFSVSGDSTARYFTIAPDGTLSLENALNASVSGNTLTITGRP